MENIGLYYPYFHIRNDTWLKAAALYLPYLARVRPPNYAIHGDSQTAVALRNELGFLRDIDPRSQAKAVAEEFATFAFAYPEALRERYGVDPSGCRHGFGAEVHDPWLLDQSRFAWIHRSQLAYEGIDYQSPLNLRDLREMGLAHLTRFDPVTGVRDDAGWIGMHPRLVSAYSYVLADRLAQANSLRGCCSTEHSA